MILVDILYTEHSIDIGYDVKFCLNYGSICCGRCQYRDPVDSVGVAYRVAVFGLD